MSYADAVRAHARLQFNALCADCGTQPTTHVHANVSAFVCVACAAELTALGRDVYALVALDMPPDETGGTSYALHANFNRTVNRLYLGRCLPEPYAASLPAHFHDVVQPAGGLRVKYLERYARARVCMLLHSHSRRAQPLVRRHCAEAADVTAPTRARRARQSGCTQRIVCE